MSKVYCGISQTSVGDSSRFVLDWKQWAEREFFNIQLSDFILYPDCFQTAAQIENQTETLSWVDNSVVFLRNRCKTRVKGLPHLSTICFSIERKLSRPSSKPESGPWNIKHYPRGHSCKKVGSGSWARRTILPLPKIVLHRSYFFWSRVFLLESTSSSSTSCSFGPSPRLGWDTFAKSISRNLDTWVILTIIIIVFTNTTQF